jgi:hypothetical protein
MKRLSIIALGGLLFVLTACTTNPYPNLKVNKVALTAIDEDMKDSLKDLNEAVEEYKLERNHKAFFIALDSDGSYAWGKEYGAKTQRKANRGALKYCKEARAEYEVESTCKPYMEGDRVVGVLLQKRWK